MSGVVFILAYTLSQFFRSFLAVIAPELSTELNLSAADLGTMSAVWFVTFALAQFPVGWALDHIGPRRTIPVLMTAAVAGALLFARAARDWHCHLAMALIGLGCSPVYMGALYVFGRLYKPERFAMLSSWLLGVGLAGNLLGTAPLAYAARTFGWRPTFAGIAVLTLAIAALARWAVRDPPRAANPSSGGHALRDLAGIAAIRALWPLVPIALVSYAVVIAERAIWIGPYFAEVHGLDTIARGNAALAMAVAMVIGAFAYGPLDRLFGSRRGVVLAGSAVTGLAFLALGLWPQPDVRVAVGLLAAIGVFGSTYAVLMAHARSFFPEHLLGRGITFMNFLFIGGAGLIQVLSGVLVDALTVRGIEPAETYAALHFALGAALLLSAAVYVAARER
ncbi:MAG: MFS transporter [Hyphomicrobiaceae bacterium]